MTESPKDNGAEERAEAVIRSEAQPTGELWRRTQERTARALRCGAIRPIPTTFEVVEEAGVRFLVRVVDSLKRKDAAAELARIESAGRAQALNPFLPYDRDLFVADLSDSHVLLLNKFNVLDHHLLVVTRTFEDQEELLRERDLAALWACMREIDGVGFYNGGEAAGASQPHKHLQLAPPPLAPGHPQTPIEPVLDRTRLRSEVGCVEELPFAHALARIEPALTEAGPDRAAPVLLARYRALLEAVGLREVCGRRSAPYNLLLTRRWMLVVPRSRERFEGISVNALGFAGALLVRDTPGLELVRRRGPFTILREVGFPR